MDNKSILDAAKMNRDRAVSLLSAAILETAGEVAIARAVDHIINSAVLEATSIVGEALKANNTNRYDE